MKEIYKKPTYMSDDIYITLIYLLDTPWYKWNQACGMARPWAPWKIRRFIHYVNVTRMAIRETLMDKFYPRQAIPNVLLRVSNGQWILDVQTWGNPDIQKV